MLYRQRRGQMEILDTIPEEVQIDIHYDWMCDLAFQKRQFKANKWIVLENQDNFLINAVFARLN